MRYLLLVLLTGCQLHSTGVLHRFSDDALEVARCADPEADWEPEVDPVRPDDLSYVLPHTELITLRGSVDDAAALFDSLEAEAGRTLLRNGMEVREFTNKDEDGLRRSRWVYVWGKCEGVLTIWGRALEGDDYLLAFTIHESRAERW